MTETKLSNESFHLVLNILRLWGLCPIDRLPKKVFVFYTWFLHFTIIVPGPVLSFLYISKQHLNNIQEISDTIFVTTQLGINIIRYVPLRLYPENYKKLVETLDIKTFNSYSTDQRRFINDALKFIKLLTNIHMTQIVITAILVVITPLFSVKKDFALNIWIPFNLQENVYIYWIIYSQTNLRKNYNFQFPILCFNIISYSI